MDDDVCDRTAVELARAIRARDLSAREVLDAHLQRIDLWNPVVNAIVTRTTGRAVARAGALDEAFARGEESGPSTACRSPTRIWSIPPVSVRPTARRSMRITCPTTTNRSSRGSARL